MERARTIVFIVREAHGEVSGSVLEPLFSRSLREGLSGGFCRGAQTNFFNFLAFQGVPWEALFNKKSNLF